MSLPSGIAAFTASGKTSARPYPTGRPRVGGCYPLGPSSRTSSNGHLSRAPRNGSGCPKDAADESTFPWPDFAANFSSSFASMTVLARTIRRAPAAHTSHCLRGSGLYTQLAARPAPRTPLPRTGDGRSSTDERRRGYASPNADHSEPCSAVCFVPSLGLSDCPAKRPRSHSKGSTSLIADRRFLEGCLDVDALLQLQIIPSRLIISLTTPGWSSTPQCAHRIFIDNGRPCL